MRVPGQKGRGCSMVSFLAVGFPHGCSEIVAKLSVVAEKSPLPGELRRSKDMEEATCALGLSLPTPTKPLVFYKPRRFRGPAKVRAHDRSFRKRVSDFAAKLVGPNTSRLTGIEVKHFGECSLAYVELGTIIDACVRFCFGDVAAELHRSIGVAMAEGSGSRRVNGWISGCLLQYADASLEDLMDFCVKVLQYKPAMSWTLCCLKCRRYPPPPNAKDAETAKMQLENLLLGLHEKVSISEFKRIAAMGTTDRSSYVFRRYKAALARPQPDQLWLPRPQPDGLGLLGPQPDELGLLGLQPGEPKLNVPSVTDAATRFNNPALMYCLPDYLTAFLEGPQ